METENNKMETSESLSEKTVNDGINFKLEVFEGPLDLMLSLISKHKLNIRDIEISILLEQFLNFIEQSKERDIEIAGEFLEMTAHLIYIKSASLLPKHEAELLKKELEGVLIEYALCKEAAKRLHSQYVGDLIFTRKTEEIEIDMTYMISHSVEELYMAFNSISDRSRLKSQPSFTMPIDEIEVKYVSVFSKIIFILKKIRSNDTIEIDELFVGLKKSERVAMFLALLELSSHGRIKFSEELDYIEFASKD